MVSERLRLRATWLIVKRKSSVAKNRKTLHDCSWYRVAL